MTLSDTQLIILSAASQRTDHAVILPANLKGSAAKKVTDRLLKQNLLQELRAKDDMPVWRRGDDNRPYTLRITEGGLKAIEVGGVAVTPEYNATAGPNGVVAANAPTETNAKERPRRARRSAKKAPAPSMKATKASSAQFEREVTGERIRDKIAASKQKGMWMGGWVPIGYDRKDRTLVVNEEEARTVRAIFELFLKLRNVRKVQVELARLKLSTKPYPISTGKVLGGLSFSRGHIYRILSNPLYIGEIAHKGIRHAGQHPRIIDQEIWDAVSALLGSNRREHRVRAKAGHASLLAGLIYDEAGRPLVSSHSTKNGKRYLYYITSDGSGRHPVPAGQVKLRLPAVDVDAFVRRFLTDSTGLAKLLRAAQIRSGRLAEALQKAEATSQQLEAMSFRSRLELVTHLLARIDVMQAGLRMTFRVNGILRYLIGGESAGYATEEDTLLIDFPMPTLIQNGAIKLVVTQPYQESEDASLITAIARGTCWLEELISGKASSISEIARRENVTDSYISRLLNLALLSPTIVQQVLEGNPTATKIASLEMTGQRLPALWRKQYVTLQSPSIPV